MFALRNALSVCYKTVRCLPCPRFVYPLRTRLSLRCYNTTKMLLDTHFSYPINLLQRPASAWNVDKLLTPGKESADLELVRRAKGDKCPKDKKPCGKKGAKKGAKEAKGDKKDDKKPAKKDDKKADKKADDKKGEKKKAPAPKEKGGECERVKAKAKLLEERKKSSKKEKCGKEKRVNLAAIMYGVEDLRMEQRPIPKVGPKDVLLAMDCIGICGSDVHYLKHGKIGPFVVKKPMILGHEASGIVTTLGKSVKHLKVGDRVSIEPGEPCRFCDYCKRGAYNLCPKMKFCATPPVDGNLMRYYKHPADFCYKIPDHVTMEEGALMEPLAVGCAACRRAKLQLGGKILIMGAGPIGLCTLLVAKSVGAANIYITDIKPDRLALAKKLGASEAMVMCDGYTPEDMVQIIKEKMGSLPDVVFDCVGSCTTARLGVFATRTGGVCVLVGLAGDEIPLPLADALSREVDLRGVFRYCNDYTTALSLMSSGKISNIKYMVTHHFSLEEAQDAFDTVPKGIKVIIHAQDRDKNNKKPFDSFKPKEVTE